MESEELSASESSRESWVQTVNPDLSSPVKVSDSKNNYVQKTQKSNIREEYKKQIFDYLRKLFLNLNLLVNADEV